MGRFSLARKLATSLLVAFLVGALAAATVRLRPAPDPDGPERQDARSSLAAIDRLETGLFDVLARRQARSRPASPDLVLVNLDEASVKRARETAGGWPWTREYLGRLTRELHALGARLVVLDADFPDASRLSGDDARFARALDKSGDVVAGFRFADAPEEGFLEPGRWAVAQGSYATRGAAMLAAGPLLAEGSRPYLIPAGERVEVWVGGYRDRAEAQRDADRLHQAFGAHLREGQSLRELKAEETLDRVTPEALFAERNSVPFSGGGGQELKTFQTLQPPVAELAASRVGFGNLRLERDEDGVVRGVRHLWRYEGRYYPSLALAAAMALTGKRAVSIDGSRLSLGDLSVPLDGAGVTRLRFYGRGEREGAPDSPYPVIPVLSVVRSAERRAAGKSLDEKLAEKIQGKVVFVSFEIDQCERTPTPIASASLRASAWATALDNLLRSDGLVRASPDQDSAVAFVMALLGALVSLFLTRGTRPWRTFLLMLVVAGLIAAGYLFWAERSYRAGLWVASAVPLLAFALGMLFSTLVNFVDERRAAGHIRDALGRHALPGIVEQLLRRPQHLAEEGERLTLTSAVIWLDGYAQAAETARPKDLVTVLDELVALTGETVTAHKGQVDRVVGARVVAYWGAPLPNARHAIDACLCALELRDRLGSRLAAWKEKLGGGGAGGSGGSGGEGGAGGGGTGEGVELAPRIGVCTGPMIVGNLTGWRRARYAVFGKPMVGAERLAEAAKGLGTLLLVSDATFEQARELVGARELDLVRLPGRGRPLRAIELRGLKRQQAADDLAFCERFEKAVASFRRREFQAALEQFEALARERPADGPVALYVERCRACLESPPGEEWDGVFEDKGPSRG